MIPRWLERGVWGITNGIRARHWMMPIRGVDCEISHWLERGIKHSFIREYKPLFGIHVLTS